MNSGGFPSGLFMLDRLSHLKGGVPAGGGGLLPGWYSPHWEGLGEVYFYPDGTPSP